MDHSYFIIGFLIIILIVLAIRLGQAHQKNDELELKLISFNTKRLAAQLNELLLNVKLKETPKFTPTTEKLLSLAAKSNNQNEAAAAAVQACKRIHKELGYK